MYFLLRQLLQETGDLCLLEVVIGIGRFETDRARVYFRILFDVAGKGGAVLIRVLLFVEVLECILIHCLFTYVKDEIDRVLFTNAFD